MSSDSVVPKDDGVGLPFDTSLNVGTLVDVVKQKFQDILFILGQDLYTSCILTRHT